MENHFSETLLLLFLLLAVGSVGNEAEANTRSRSSDYVLYSNPQYYSLPTEQQQEQQQQQLFADGGYGPPMPEAISVMGLLFNLRSRLVDENATLYVTGFEFYASLAGTVYYELSTREGPYYDEDAGRGGGPGIGERASFDVISSGFVEGTGECDRVVDHYAAVGGDSSSPKFEREKTMDDDGDDGAEEEWRVVCDLTVVPEEGFGIAVPNSPNTRTTIALAANSTRSFYIGLSSGHLLVSPGNIASDDDDDDDDGRSFDDAVTASDPYLELYEGAAALTYPFHERDDSYREGPAGFIGKIRYRLEEDTGDDGTTTTAPSSASPVLSPPPTSSEATAGPPSIASSTGTEWNETVTILGGMAPDASPQPAPTPTTMTTSSPTAKPTRRCRPGRPCLAPSSGSRGRTTSTPTGAPLISSAFPTTVELVVCLENVSPGRVMNKREEREYVEVVTEFLTDNTNLRKSGVISLSVEIFHHDLFVEEEKAMPKDNNRGKKARGKARKRDRRALLEGADESFVYSYNANSNYVPETYPAVYVMTKVEVVTKLPHRVAAYFVWDEMRYREAALVDAFGKHSAFVSYFWHLTNVTVEVVDGMTKPPTPAPTTVAAAALESEGGEEEGRGFVRDHLLAYVGVGLVCLWAFLTLCGLREVLKARREGFERKELNRQRVSFRRQSKLEAAGASVPTFATLKNAARRTLSLDFYVHKETLGLQREDSSTSEGTGRGVT